MKTVYICIATAVVIIAGSIGMGETPTTQEAERRIEVPKSDVMKLLIRDNKPILVAATQRSVGIKGDRLQDMPLVSATCYHLNVDNAKLTTSMLGHLQFHAFDMWVLSSLDPNSAHIIGYDVEGTNPLEPPNNPMGRLTVAVCDFSKEEPGTQETTADVAREAFRSKYAKAGQRTYIRGKGILFESARNIDATTWNGGSGMCLGITNKEGVWAKAFSPSDLKWDKELGFVKGEYVDVAVVSVKSAIGILTADRTGRIGYRSIKSATGLADSKDDTVAKAASWKDGEHPVRVAVSADGEDVIAGIVLEKQGEAAKNTAGKTQAVKRLVIYRGRQGVWQSIGSYALEPSIDRISLLAWNKMVLCAYSCAKGGEACGIVRILTPPLPTSLQAPSAEDLRSK